MKHYLAFYTFTTYLPPKKETYDRVETRKQLASYHLSQLMCPSLHSVLPCHLLRTHFQRKRLYCQLKYWSPKEFHFQPMSDLNTEQLYFSDHKGLLRCGGASSSEAKQMTIRDRSDIVAELTMSRTRMHTEWHQNGEWGWCPWVSSSTRVSHHKIIAFSSPHCCWDIQLFLSLFSLLLVHVNMCTCVIACIWRSENSSGEAVVFLPPLCEF